MYIQTEFELNYKRTSNTNNMKTKPNAQAQPNDTRRAMHMVPAHKADKGLAHTADPSCSCQPVMRQMVLFDLWRHNMQDEHADQWVLRPTGTRIR
jgi:hypothetical protein